MLLEIVGFVAFSTSIVSLIPQLYHTYTTKSANDVSLLMLVNFVLGSISWVVYGALTNATEVWLTNGIWAISSLAMIGLKFYYNAK